MEARPYLGMLAEALTSELTSNHSIRQFTKNPALIGAFAEATVRKFVKKAVNPHYVSHGSIVYEDNCGTGARSKPPQLDTIIWTPGFLTPIFESGEFALVPRGSAVAALEIKSTNYSGASNKIRKTLGASRDLFKWTPPSDPFWKERKHLLLDGPFSMGVVCIRRHVRDKVLDDLISAGEAVALLDESRHKKLTVSARGVYQLFEFLMLARQRAAYIDGQNIVDYKKFFPTP